MSNITFFGTIFRKFYFLQQQKTGFTVEEKEWNVYL